MAQSDVDLIARLYERWGMGDYNTPDFFDPEVDYARVGATVPGDDGQWRGIDAMWRAAVSYLREWEDMRNVAEQIIDLGDNVLVLDRQTGRGRRSGATLDHELAQVFTVKDGKIVRWSSYWDRDEAMKALERD